MMVEGAEGMKESPLKKIYDLIDKEVKEAKPFVEGLQR